MARDLPDPAQLATSQGYVVVSLPKGDGMRIPALYPNQVPFAVRVERVDAPGTVVSLSQRPGLQLAYGAWLPAGQWRIVKWDVHDWAPPATFEVRAGRVTDLGSLLAVDVGRFEVQVVPAPANSGLDDSLERVLRQYPGVFTDPQPLTWSPTAPLPVIVREAPYGTGGLLGSFDNDKTFKRNLPEPVASLHAPASNALLLRNLKQVAPPIDVGRIGADGTSYFPADFGVVRARAPDGTWRSLDTGTLERIYVVAVNGNVLLAGTASGRVLSSADAGATWKQSAQLPPSQNVTDISRVGDRWFVTGTQWVDVEKGGARASMLQVWTSTHDDGAELASLKEFPLAEKLALNWVGRAQGGANAYFVNLPEGLQRYEIATQQWKTVAPKPVVTFRIDDTGQVLTALAYGGLFKRATYVSHDGGTTWTTRSLPYMLLDDAMFDADDTGTAFRLELAVAGTKRSRLITYDAKKDDWVRVGFLPNMCRPMRTGAAVPAMCVTTGMDIWALHDGKWLKEFDAN